MTNAEGEGVALVCDNDGLPTMFDITSGDTLAVGLDGQCFDWDYSTLEVINTKSGSFMADGCPTGCGSNYALWVVTESESYR